MTIPSSDTAFRQHVLVLVKANSVDTPAALEQRLRRLYPRVRVRSRELSAEAPVWYVYRDGSWRPAEDHDWWRDPRVGRLELTRDGWIRGANALARGLLGIGDADPAERHFSDFFATGALADASALFELIVAGQTLDATVRLRPLSGDVIALDLRAALEGDAVIAVMRLAEDVEAEPHVPAPLPDIEAQPASDTVFAGYVGRIGTQMPEPTPDGLALRLHRLYPHATVDVVDGRWVVRRDGTATVDVDEWWIDPGHARVRYDDQGLILDANEPALRLLGRDVVGRHWQDLVTPGSTAQVGPVIEMIRAAGYALSRFRMPAHDGTLVEFDSYTAVDGDVLTTSMRPV